MGAGELTVTERFAYREARPEGEETGPPVLLLHGFPESSLMWEPLMAALAGRGRRSLAPDLYGLGDSPDDGSATFERNRDMVAAFHEDQKLGKVALVVHDWGAFAGLAWACEHPGSVAALVISDAGFFADGRWHGIAEAIRAPDGERLIEALDRDGFAGLLRGDGASFDEATVDAYWRPFDSGRGRRATVEFYRSMDFDKLAPYEGGLAALGVPTLLLWGAEDRFAPIGGAKRFEREIPGAQLVAIEGAGHFVFDQEPERAIAAALEFIEAS
jgi:haloalkane dehalogenase